MITLRVLLRLLTMALLLLDAPAIAAPAAGMETRVTIRVRNAPVAQFLDAISERAKINFVIKDGADKARVNASLQDVTVREALDVLAETKGLRYRKLAETNTYAVEPQEAPVPKDALAACPDLPKTKMSVRLKETKLGEFFDAVSSQAKISFSLADGLQARKVTAFLQKVTVAEALAIVLDLKGLRCRRSKNSGVYLIEP